ncbi:hypothetical protein GCM10009841_31750 [Microlunatus panaciterrae]|uniref:Galactose mutarotase n=1 Tax=Microlunatus panaciterrae TaxID=400768 RepID=A0ABS2RFQ2_9ACTN|nr:hypothetical protein [Microlunatus panaciterrae]MBM7797833.1 hypothetical protein [Microlunatus panaciterrae]
MPELEQLTYRGWEVLRLTTEEVTVDVVPGLGGTIISLQRRSDGTDVLLRTPWGLRARGAATLPGDSDTMMIDSFAGGWQTTFPNGGNSAIVHGAEWGYDGEARVTPMDWELSGTSVIMTGHLVRSPFEITKIISLSGSTVTLAETVRNTGAESMEVMWGSQVSFGPPLLGPDTIVDAAAATVHPDSTIVYRANYEDITPWPRTLGDDSMINLRNLPGPDGDEMRLAYLGDFYRPHLSVTNPDLDLCVTFEWDAEMWPYVWYSLEAGHREGFPWYGNGYFLTLQPGSSWPAHGLHDARRISQTTVWVPPGGAKSAHLSLTIGAPTLRS